ncbi:MAG: hypothetical protein ACOYN0_05570 [Phycisphaerales bacterium]
MKCCGCRGMSSGVIGFGLLMLGGVAGYNTITTGCPLGMCSDEVRAVEPAAASPTAAASVHTPDASPATPETAPVAEQEPAQSGAQATPQTK